MLQVLSLFDIITTAFRPAGEMAELVEGARLEIAYTLIAYQGFESLSLRQAPEDEFFLGLLL